MKVHLEFRLETQSFQNTPLTNQLLRKLEYEIQIVLCANFYYGKRTVFSKDEVQSQRNHNGSNEVKPCVWWSKAAKHLGRPAGFCRRVCVGNFFRAAVWSGLCGHHHTWLPDSTLWKPLPSILAVRKKDVFLTLGDSVARNGLPWKWCQDVLKPIHFKGLTGPMEPSH